jgi:hypothetical protein
MYKLLVGTPNATAGGGIRWGRLDLTLAATPRTCPYDFLPAILS